jgi:hypothetical protein
MKQRSARRHYDSPQSIIRKELDGNIREGVTPFLRKNCPEGQEEEAKKDEEKK